MKETNILIETNIDDMNPQLYEHAAEKLFEAGALDVFLQNIMMKKFRPGIKLSILCEEKARKKVLAALFEETTAIGARILPVEKVKLERRVEKVETKHGVVNIKIAEMNGKVLNARPEYGDCRKIALAKKVPLKKVMAEAEAKAKELYSYSKNQYS